MRILTPTMPPLMHSLHCGEFEKETLSHRLMDSNTWSPLDGSVWVRYRAFRMWNFSGGSMTLWTDFENLWFSQHPVLFLFPGCKGKCYLSTFSGLVPLRKINLEPKAQTNRSSIFHQRNKN